MTASPILCTIDLDAPGSRSAGCRCRARRTRAGGRTSTSRSSPWRAARADSARPGRRPRDEPEGQVAALNLARAPTGAGERARDRDPVRVDRRVARVHAALAVGREHEPLVPGSPTGRPDEQLAHFLSTVLFPRSDIVVDMHSGGRTGLCLPWSEDALGRRRRAARAHGGRDAPLEHRLVLRLHRHRRHRPARRRGGTAGEDRGQHGARRRRARHRRDPRLAASGLQNVLRRFGAIEGERDARRAGAPRAGPAMATELDNYLLAQVRPLRDARRPRSARVGRRAGRPDPLPSARTASPSRS